MHIITCEQVSCGHPDKICDQIADAIVTDCLKHDPKSRVAIECLIKDNHIIIAGELTSDHEPDYQGLVYEVFNRIGLDKIGGVFDPFFSALDIGILVKTQSPDIAIGVDKGGAGDQGMMFGYAVNETENLMPVSLDIAHLIMRTLADIRREGKVMTYLRPDAKSQVTIEYSDEGIPQRIDTIVVSTQHDEFDDDEKMLERIKNDVINILIPRVKQHIHSAKVLALFNDDIKYYVNPTGKFVIGGPHGDTGLTGRKIIVDTYGGKGAHGGGAFSGKDPSKVDRSAAYATRHIAKNLVAAGIADEVLVQVAYAIGVAQPVGIYVNTYGTKKVSLSDGEIAQKIAKIFDLRPAAIIRRLKLKNPIFQPTAAYGHFGRTPYTKDVTFIASDGTKTTKSVDFFTWEKLDYVDTIKREFGLA